MPLPFLIPPITWAAGLLIVGSAARAILKNNPDFFKSSDRVRLAILGLNQSGKTTLQDFLRGTRQMGSGGTVIRGDKVKEVSITLNDRTIILLESMDPSGSPEGLRLHIDEEVMLSDKIFFLIKGDNFLADENYKKENRALLFSIVKKMNEYKKESNIWIYITHRDKMEVREEEKTKKEILNFLLKTDSQELQIKKRIEKIDMVNLTLDSSLNILKNELFKIS